MKQQGRLHQSRSEVNVQVFLKKYLGKIYIILLSTVMSNFYSNIMLLLTFFYLCLLMPKFKKYITLQTCVLNK